MIWVVLLLAVLALALCGTAALVRQDRSRATPHSRFVDPDFLPPAQRSGIR